MGNITALGVGLVRWSDIPEVKETLLEKSIFIELVVKNRQAPKATIEQQFSIYKSGDSTESPQ